MRIWLPLIATGTGAEVYTRRLAKGLAERGHQVELSAAPHCFQYAPWLAPLRPPPGVDVTLGNSWNAAAFSYAAPMVTVVHHVVHDPALARHKSLAQSAFHRAFVRPMELRALAASAAVVAVSEASAVAIRRHLADVPVEVVLNGIDTEFFRPPEQRPPRDPSAPVKLLFVGTPSTRKGFDTVAEIVAALGAGCSLTCVGPSPGRAMPHPPGRYLGTVTDAELRQAYQEADLLLLPSRLEGFGYAAAEAMACGVPVVCAEGGAVAEIAPPPECAITCRAGDSAAFAAAISALAADTQRLEAMRGAARANAVARLDIRRWVDEMERVLMRAARRNVA